MDKKIISQICNCVGILLVIVFIVKSCIDYSNYSIDNSAPFSVWIMINALYFIIPAIIFFISGFIIRKRH